MNFRTFGLLCACGLVVSLFASPVQAQEFGDCQSAKQFTIERTGLNQLKLVGDVELECGDTKFFAESVELFLDTHKLVSTGNVVFTSGGSRIAADRAEFNTQTRTGTFFNASGTASLGERVDRSMFGTQEPDAIFYGETIEKLGPRKYRITKGWFTTCVQPTPRWELVTSTAILNLEEYAILKNSLLRVKGTPLFYLPVMYYPINKEDRATGFLLPIYGTSTVRGQSLSNAFFWAINRSQDATFFHDFFSKTGQGIGGEYRYVMSQGSAGDTRMYFLNEHEAIFPSSSGGAPTVTPGRRSYTISGNMGQVIAPGVRARARVDYFSDVTVQQTYNQNLYDSSNRQRRISGNVTATRGTYTLSGTYDRSETFYGARGSSLTGGAPRFTFSRAERPIAGTPLYFAVNGEFANILREKSDQVTVIDPITGLAVPTDLLVETGFRRFDVAPLLRFPFRRWPFLTVNSSVVWRNTFWNESRDPANPNPNIQIAEPITRRFFDMQSQVTGPVFARIFNTPNNGYAERFKHVIEPNFTIQRTTAIDNYDRIVQQFDSLDSIVGNVTRISYGLTNRLYAKRRETTGPSVSREIVNVAMVQSYYTDARASQFDRQFGTSFTGVSATHWSPISIGGRLSPTDQIQASVRAEYDTQYWAFRSIQANGTFARGTWLQTVAGWSQRRYIEKLAGFNNRDSLDHYLNAATNLRTPTNKFGGVYSFNYDLLRDRMLQQRVLGYYHAQCCGFSVEFQTFNFSGLGSRAPVSKDRRFNFSFTLAGIGSFSNPFGGLNPAGPQRRF